MTIPEIVMDMAWQTRPISYDGDIVRERPIPATVDIWSMKIQSVYMELIANLSRISHELGGHHPADCDNATPSEEYLKEYAEDNGFKYHGDNRDENLRDDAKWDMDCCQQCGNEECAVVKLRRLVDPLREEINRMKEMDNAGAKGL